MNDAGALPEPLTFGGLKRWRIVSVVQAAVVSIGDAITEKDVAETVPTKVKVEKTQPTTPEKA